MRVEEAPPHRLEEVDMSSHVFRKLRQNSKQIFQSSSSGKRRGSIVDDLSSPDLSYLKVGKGRLTFFDLPPEIRNVIYEDVASGTRVFIPSTAAKKKEKESKTPPATTPSLLLVSKQVRIEYLPLLLECATISFAVRDFDFRNLMRVSSSLFSTELKALRKNPRITIRLLAQKPHRQTLAALRRWAQRRTEDMYTFPVHYSLVWPILTQLVPTSSSVHRINTYIARRAVLVQNVEALATLSKEVPEALQWELQPVMEVFETEMEVLGAMGSGSGGRTVDPFGEGLSSPMFRRNF